LPQPRLGPIERLLQALPELPVDVPHGLHAFFYHLVSDRELPHVRHLYAFKTPAQFEEDLRLLSREFRLVPHADIVRHVRDGKPLPERAAAISFDDGFAECFELVRPLLLRHGVPCTFFVVRDLLDNRLLMHKHAVSLCLEALATAPEEAVHALAQQLGAPAERGAVARRLASLGLRERASIDAACGALGVDTEAALAAAPYLSREQVRQLARDGFTIGGHSCRHAELDRLPGETDLEREIAESCAFVRELTGQAEVPFAITFNGLRLPRAGLAAALARHPFVSLIYDTNDLMPDHPRVLNRIWADTPAGTADGRSNLPLLLKRAKALEPVRRWKRRWQGLPR
jgi:peptidoglycan/xylan/chitin deacetylase (PgdA/CDA1 family)